MRPAIARRAPARHAQIRPVGAPWSVHSERIQDNGVMVLGARRAETSLAYSLPTVLGRPRMPEPIPPIRVDNFEIDLVTLIAVYPEELEYSVDHGAEALVERFAHAHPVMARVARRRNLGRSP